MNAIFAVQVFTCKSCQKHFDSQKHLNDHNKQFHQDKRFHCVCGKSYTRKLSLKKHQEKCKASSNEKIVEEYLDETNKDPDLSGFSENLQNSLMEPRKCEFIFFHFMEIVCSDSEEDFKNYSFRDS
jgi:hypothetical protein